MALNQNKRQKKLQRKVKKRKQNLAKKKNNLVISTNKAINYGSFPIHDCLVPDRIFEVGLGSILISRQSPSGLIAFSSFVVDVFCLGVKDCFFQVYDELEYEHIKSHITHSLEDQTLQNFNPSCALKLINGAVEYAQKLDFSPHPDYKNAKNIFGNINFDNCPDDFTYGKDGKPFYFQGPFENPAKVQKIINQLTEKCGEDGFDYFTVLDDVDL